MHRRILACLLPLLSLFTLNSLAMPPVAPASDLERLFAPLKYRNIGPMAGGRVCRVCGVPGDNRTWYAATASGGVWKTSDGGISWTSLMDDQPLSSAGSIAVAQSDPNVIYVGGGEANIRGNVVSGTGIFKSTDAGRTWKHVWKEKAQIGTMIVHPRDPNIAFAAVLGRVSGPSSERGVYRTVDGGKSWQRVLYHDMDTGASDICFDPSNPSILFAGFWHARRKPWELISGGPGSGLHVSRDGGDTWERLGPHDSNKKPSVPRAGPLEPGTGLPPGPWGKVGVAVAPSDSERIYAIIEAEKGGLYRSDDGGRTWSLASDDRKLRQRAWYYSTITVHPENPDILFAPQVPMLRSIDGGRTFEEMDGLYHGDNHDIWIDPLDPRRMIVGNDGGVNLTVNGGKTWYAPPLPISQFYRINVDTRTPYHVSGTMQDLGSAAGPSNSLNFMGIRLADWYNVGGGETGYTVPDPKDPNIVYAGEYAGILTRFDYRTRSARHIGIFPDNSSGHGAADVRYRFRWPAPLAGSPHDPKALYHAAQVLFKSTNGGQNWTAISGDLTRNDKSRQQWSGGPITGDNTTAEFYCTISAVAESPKQAGLLWVGSDDGLVHLSKDGGKTWTNLTAKLPKFPEWATVKMIEPSPHDAGTAYVVVEAHLLDDDRPYLFKTTDFGETWKEISRPLPQDAYLHVCREDPAARGLLFVGTEAGLHFSPDGGITWHSLKLNLPTVPVVDLRVKSGDLVVGTSGRSLWILDDLTPLRSLPGKDLSASATLLQPAVAIRWNYHGPITGHEAHSLANPPMGAVLHYHLGKEAKSVRMEIRDSKDQLVAQVKADQVESAADAEEEKKDEAAENEPNDDKEKELPAEPGLYRVVWPMTQEGAKPIRGAVADMGSPEAGPRVNPGSYHVVLRVDEVTLRVPLEIRPDPRRNIPAADLQEQEALAVRIRGELNQLSQTANKLRSLLRQIKDREELLAADDDAKELLEKSKDFEKKLSALEEKLHNPKAKIAYDVLAQKGGAKLYSRLVLLYNFVIDGEGAPTQGMREVHAELVKLLESHLAEWRQLLAEDLPKLNKLCKKKYPILVVPVLKEEKQ